VQLEGFGQFKNSTSSESEPMTLRLAALYLNRYTTEDMLEAVFSVGSVLRLEHQ
jgi:hypothetical protein